MFKQIFIDYVSGVCGGIAVVLVGHPFDTTKTRLQTAPQGFYSGTIDCVKKTLKWEGNYYYHHHHHFHYHFHNHHYYLRYTRFLFRYAIINYHYNNHNDCNYNHHHHHHHLHNKGCIVHY